MAAITLETLRSTIRFRGDFQNVRKFPDASLDVEIQRAFAEFYQIVADCNEGYWDTQATVTTVANQGYVALPGDAWRVNGIDRPDSRGELKQVGPEARHRFPDTGEPLGYRLTARGADLYPTPNAAYTLTVLYTPLAPHLAQSQPREWYNGWEEYVIQATLLSLEQREKQPIQERLALLEKAKQHIIEGASKRRQQEPEYLRLREVEGFDPYDDGAY